MRETKRKGQSKARRETERERENREEKGILKKDRRLNEHALQATETEKNKITWNTKKQKEAGDSVYMTHRKPFICAIRAAAAASCAKPQKIRRQLQNTHSKETRRRQGGETEIECNNNREKCNQDATILLQSSSLEP